MREPQPFFRKQTGSWYVKLGKDFIPLGRDEAEAREEYHEIMAKRRKATVTAEDSVAHLIDLRWNWVKKNLAPTTATRIKGVLTSFKAFIGPKLKVRKLKPFHVTNWLDEKYPTNGDTSRHTLITHVKGAFTWAAEQGYIEVSPIANMKKPSPAIRQEFLHADVWPKVIALATDEPFKEFLTVMLDSGARPQEMFKIEAHHLDGRQLVFEIKDSKGKKRNRVIWLPDSAFKIVVALAKKYPTGSLFRNSKGIPWNKDSVRCRFRRLKKRLNEPKLTATTLRHSYAHNRLISGQEPLYVSKLMGHVDGRMLATRYGHIEKNSDFMAAQANLITFPKPQPTAAKAG